MLDHGRYHDNCTTTCGDHGGYAGLGELHGTEEIHLHGPPPAVEVGILDRLEAAGIVRAVKQHVDAAKGRQRRVRQRLALGLLGNIGDHLQHFRAEAQGRDIRFGRRKLLRRTRRQHHRGGALPGRQHGEFLPQAGTDPGDDDNLVLQ